MDPIERIVSLQPYGDSLGWSDDDFGSAAREAFRRWREARNRLGVEFYLFGDGVADIEPSFQIPESDVESIRSSSIPEGRNCRWTIGLAFVKWERCATTKQIPNPYEPLVQIWEHGGHLSMEHGVFMDVECASGTRFGITLIRADEWPRKVRSPKKSNRRQRRL